MASAQINKCVLEPESGNETQGEDNLPAPHLRLQHTGFYFMDYSDSQEQNKV